MTTASYFKTPGGRAGIQDTLQRMRGIVHKSVRDPRLIALARQLTAVLKARDYAGEIKVLFEWVRDNIRYARDVEGVETLIEPYDLVFNLELGRQGDCDDFAMLLATLLKIMGHRARFKAGTVNGARQGHVWVEVFLDGKWIPLDAIYQINKVGYCPPNMGNFIIVSVEGYEEDSMAGAEKDYVKLAVQDGKVVGIGLTKEALEQLKREMPNMGPVARQAAARILFHDALAKKGITLDGTVGADVLDSGTTAGAVTETAASFIPGGSIVLGIGKALKGLFGGGMKEEMKRRTGMMDTFKKVFEATEPLVSQFQNSAAGQWANRQSKKLLNPGYADYNLLQHALDPWNQWIVGVYKDKVYNDKTKNNTGGFSNADAALGNQANAASSAGIKTRDGSTNLFLILAERMQDVMDLYLKTEAAKLAPPPTPATVTTVATTLQTSTDPNSQALGNGIINAQNQTYPTYPENTPIPAGAISIVGEYMGAAPVRTVQPGDRVNKGETITSNVPIVIKNGVVAKPAATIFGLPANVVYIAGGSLAAAGLATAVIIMVKSKKGK